MWRPREPARLTAGVGRSRLRARSSTFCCHGWKGGVAGTASLPPALSRPRVANAEPSWDGGRLHDAQADCRRSGMESAYRPSMKRPMMMCAVIGALGFIGCGGDVEVKSPDDADRHEERAEDKAERAEDKADRAQDKADEAR